MLMLSPQVGRTLFRITFYLAFVSAILIFVLERGSAEFIVASLTFGLGIITSLLIVIFLRRQER